MNLKATLGGRAWWGYSCAACGAGMKEPLFSLTINLVHPKNHCQYSEKIYAYPKLVFDVNTEELEPK